MIWSSLSLFSKTYSAFNISLPILYDSSNIFLVLFIPLPDDLDYILRCQGGGTRHKKEGFQIRGWINLMAFNSCLCNHARSNCMDKNAKYFSRLIIRVTDFTTRSFRVKSHVKTSYFTCIWNSSMWRVYSLYEEYVNCMWKTCEECYPFHMLFHMQFHIQIHTVLKQSKFLFSHGISHSISHKKLCEILASQ